MAWSFVKHRDNFTLPAALIPRVKRPGRGADHSPAFIAEVKNAWSYTITPTIRLHGVVLN